MQTWKKTVDWLNQLPHFFRILIFWLNSTRFLVFVLEPISFVWNMKQNPFFVCFDRPISFLLLLLTFPQWFSTPLQTHDISRQILFLFMFSFALAEPNPTIANLLSFCKYRIARVLSDIRSLPSQLDLFHHHRRMLFQVCRWWRPLRSVLFQVLHQQVPRLRNHRRFRYFEDASDHQYYSLSLREGSQLHIFLPGVLRLHSKRCLQHSACIRYFEAFPCCRNILFRPMVRVSSFLFRTFFLSSCFGRISFFLFSTLCSYADKDQKQSLSSKLLFLLALPGSILLLSIVPPQISFFFSITLCDSFIRGRVLSVLPSLHRIDCLRSCSSPSDHQQLQAAAHWYCMPSSFFFTG